jgi:hypothetical protein
MLYDIVLVYEEASSSSGRVRVVLLCCVLGDCPHPARLRSR